MTVSRDAPTTALVSDGTAERISTVAFAAREGNHSLRPCGGVRFVDDGGSSFACSATVGTARKDVAARRGTA
jgi:hypothetical protein